MTDTEFKEKIQDGIYWINDEGELTSSITKYIDVMYSDEDKERFIRLKREIEIEKILK